jgi:hypothetical protein
MLYPKVTELVRAGNVIPIAAAGYIARDASITASRRWTEPQTPRAYLIGRTARIIAGEVRV